MTERKFLYILISQTNTRFARCIRLLGHQKYNHAAISLDPDLRRVYAFARPQHNAILLGRLVRESLDRYTLRTDAPVSVALLRIPVSEYEYQWIEQTIRRMMNDPDYMYNLLSVLTYPVFKGFAVYKAYTCIEFAVYILEHVQSVGCLAKPSFQYKPDELLQTLRADIVYQGDIRGCMAYEGVQSAYFAPMTPKLWIRSLLALYRIIKRTLFDRMLA